MGITWDAQLSVGFREIDEQHQEIFRRVDVLVGNLRRGQSKEELEKLLSFLGDYVQQHFGAEEGLMLMFHYPLIGPHRAQHRSFVEVFVELRGRLDREGASEAVTEKLASFLLAWLREHIGTADRALGSFLAESGVTERLAPAAVR
ncbi:MAG: hemerythrin family protein [Deltaproteobacteria bacterium]|nr:hemerythrin family protein [Deltaproteobacteria bacterium]